MPTYNGLPFITQQVESILAQLPEDAELLIGDDSSSDGTAEYLLSLDDERITVIRRTKTFGVVKNVELLLSQANGDTIFLSDQDDVWLPHKVSTAMDRLRSGSSLVVHNAYVTDRFLNPQDETYFELLRPTQSPIMNLWRNTLIGATMAFSKEIVDRALPFPPAIPMHDIWIGLIGTVQTKVFLEPEPLMYYRRHADATSSTLLSSSRPWITRINDRIRLATALLGRFMKTRHG